MRYVGDAVGFVVAESLRQARNAADALVVDYDVLPAVVGLADALKPDAAPTNCAASEVRGGAGQPEISREIE